MKFQSSILRLSLFIVGAFSITPSEATKVTTITNQQSQDSLGPITSRDEYDTFPKSSLRNGRTSTEMKEKSNDDMEPIHTIMKVDDTKRVLIDGGNFVLLPARPSSSCPSDLQVTKEDCKAAGLSVGGRTKQNGRVREGSWNHVPFGCLLKLNGDILYNNAQGRNNGKYQSVCSEGNFLLLPAKPFSSCSSNLQVTKEDCKAAGLSVGGRTQLNGQIREGSWSWVPFGCSLNKHSGEILYSNNSHGTNNGNYQPVCRSEGYYSTNVALGRPTKQSSDGHGGVSSRAVDGNSSGNWGHGSVTHTARQSDPWWQVDLQGSYEISSINIFSRNGYQSRLADFKLEIFSKVNGQNAVFTYTHDGTPGAKTEVELESKVVGDTVQISLSGSERVLMLAEVEVNINSVRQPLVNIALDQPTKQSSVFDGCVSSRAVDGNRSGYRGDGSIAHTERQSYPYWQVDLQASYEISSINIFNRSDGGYNSRLAGFTLAIFNNGEIVFTHTAHTGTTPDNLTVIAVPKIIGDRVRISLQGDGKRLGLAEVEVFTNPLSTLPSFYDAGYNTNKDCQTFSFEGSCTSYAGINVDKIYSAICDADQNNPGCILYRDVFENMLKMVNIVANDLNLDMCMGDYNGQAMKQIKSLSSSEEGVDCSYFPVNDSITYGVLGARFDITTEMQYILQQFNMWTTVDETVSPNFCLMLKNPHCDDSVGFTGGLTLNADALTTITEVTGSTKHPIIKVISELLELGLTQATIALSEGGGLEEKVYVYLENQGPQTIIFQPHLFAQLEFANMPLPFLPEDINAAVYENLLSTNAAVDQSIVLGDLSNVDDFFNDPLETAGDLENIKVVYKVKGNLSFKQSYLTAGMLPDLNDIDASGSIYITSEEDSGVPAGCYMNLVINDLSAVSLMFDQVKNHFGGIAGLFGVDPSRDMLKLSDFDFLFGTHEIILRSWIQADEFGIQIEIGDLQLLRCKAFRLFGETKETDCEIMGIDSFQTIYDGDKFAVNKIESIDQTGTIENMSEITGATLNKLGVTNLNIMPPHINFPGFNSDVISVADNFGEFAKNVVDIFGCFSSHTRVDVMGKGTVPIHEVKVGDYIKSSRKGHGSYSRVYGFHRNDKAETFFHRIHTDIESLPLEVTPRHMVYLNGEKYPIPAAQVKIGDELQGLDVMGTLTKLTVTKIEFIRRQGFYAPITEDGTLVVDGIVASSFSVHPEKGDSVSFDKMGLIHWHGLSQVAVSPVRFICKAIWSGFCTNEDFHNEEGLHTYIIFLKRLRGLNDWQQAFALPAVLTVGLFFNSAEYIYDAIVDSVTSSKLSDGIETTSTNLLTFLALQEQAASSEEKSLL